jgi:predicted dehydrogenase
MPSSPIRVALVGATVTRGGSGWGANAHIPALQALSDQYVIKAVATAHAETAKASQEAFKAELAFDNYDQMIAHPDIDLVVVVVRVPGHYDLVMKALQAGKHVFCEWPLGRTLKEAEDMANLAESKNLRTAVGLQAQSDPSLMYVRELIKDGYVGRVQAVNFTYTGQAVTERGPGRIWQGDRRNGANTLTIAGGHAIDAVCYLLGEFEDLNARLATNITEWHDPENGETFPVDSPDWISVTGRLASGGEASFLTATVPAHAQGSRLEIFGGDGSLVVTAGSLNQGPARVQGARGKDPMEPLDTPRRFTLVPDGIKAGPPFNVAQGYVRFASALHNNQRYRPDFRDAVTRHVLIDAIERSSAEHRAVRLAPRAVGSPA